MAYYRCCGLSILSDRELYGFPYGPPQARPDLHISFGEMADEAETHQLLNGADWRFWKKSDGTGYRALYAWGASLEYDNEGTILYASRSPHCSWEDLLTLLTGPALGQALFLQGRFPLHASAVVMRGQACVFLGASGRGKSTLATALAKRGHHFLTDDLVVFSMDDDDLKIEHGLCTARLWPDSVAALYGHAESLPLISPGWDKRLATLRTDPIGESIKPSVRHLFCLGDAEQARHSYRTVSPAETFLALQVNAYMGLNEIRTRQAAELNFFSTIASRISAKIIHPPSGYDGLNDFCAWLEMVSS